MMVDWYYDQIGIVFFFQIKFSVEYFGVEIFNGDGVEIYCGDVQQKVVDVQINLFCYLLVVIFQ